jgi:flagellar operon protein (TIGR03826 family)
MCRDIIEKNLTPKGGMFMEVRVCKRCKKMFQHISGPDICPKCKQNEEELFQIVKAYLRKNPGATMSEVSQETEVSISLIESFLKQGRLEVAPNSPIALGCEGCGTRILTGRFCSKCHASLVDDLADAAKDITKSKDTANKSAEKMRFLKSDRIK